jgi:PIN domain nuclease of toxin-antitoxin system
LILLDTQVVAWLAGRPARLSDAARRTVARESVSGGIAVASVTLMELAQLVAHGEVQTARTPEAWLDRLVAELGLVVRDLTVEIATVAAHLPPTVPSDPFDRVIVATALCEGMPLVTSDQRIQDSKVVRTIW